MRSSRSSSFVRARVTALVLALALGSVLLPAGAAHGQVFGPFVAEQYAIPNAVAFQTIPTPRIWVDKSGNGLDGPGDTHHAIPPGIDATWSLSLSPSRTAIVATHGGLTGCDDLVPVEIRIYQVPPDDSDLLPLGYNNQLRCLAWMAFDDRLANPAHRTAVFVENKTSTGNTGHLLWWNLVTGEQGRSAAEYTFPINPVSFSPSGTMASVPNRVSAIGGPSYSPVELCPAGMGQASIPGPQRTNTPGAYVETGTPDPVVVYRVGGPTGTISLPSIDYVDCTTPPEPYGACCDEQGCSQEHEADCAGTWQEGVDCATAACPVAVLGIAVAGPATATRGALITCTFTASNTGTLASSNVSMVASLPFGAVFVSASGGGTYSLPTSEVSWSLGTLGGGSQTTRTVVIQAGCNVSSLNLNNYSITGTPGGTVPGSPPLVIPLTPPVTTGLSLTLLSSALAPTPLQTGDRVRHTVRIGNTSATNYDSLTVTVLTGTSSVLAQVVDAAGGYVTSSPPSLTWKGVVPASTTLDVVYETAINECRSTQPSTEALNRGSTVFLRNVCSSTMAFAIPSQSFAVAPSPFRLAIESPSHGPVQWWGSADVNRMIACRPDAEVEIDLRFHNGTAAPGPATSISMTLPAEMPAAADPPFVGTPPAGTTWDSGTGTITWSGVPAASDSVVIRFRARMDASSCSAVLDAGASYGACTNALYTELTVLSVPVPPPSHLVSVHNSSGLRYQDPAAGTGWQPLLCGAFETSRGMGRTADGTIWVAGQPCFRLNPHQLSFQIMPPSFAATLGMDTPFDVAEDPRDHTLVWTGYQAGLGLRVRRYDPATGAVTFILNDTSPQTLGVGHRVVVSSDGIIGVNTNSSLMRIDPANPAAYQRHLPPGGGSLSGLALDLDGNWLTTSHPTGPSSPRNLLHVIRDTGAFTTLVDLQPWFNWQYGMPGVAAAPDSNVYLGTYGDQFGVTRRASGNAVELLPDDLANVDLVWVGPGSTTAVGDPAPEADHAFGLSPAVPNPARDATHLRFRLPHAAHAKLELFDSQGRRVRTLADGAHAAGEHTVGWNGRDQQGRAAPAGVYFARLTSDGATRRVRLVLTR